MHSLPQENTLTTFIEELSLNAWPALQTVLYDGWIIRFASGYTKRANSVNPLYPSTIDLDAKICFCENIYHDKKIPVAFKITHAIYPSDLEERLSAKGYAVDSPTSVQFMKLDSIDVEVSHEVSIQEELSAEWLDRLSHMNAIAEPNRETLRQMLTSIVPLHCLASLMHEGRAVACGMGVLQSGHIGLFDIVTDGAFRNRGYGRKVVESIMAWGKQKGAQKAYLQVMLNNPPALHLYSKIGFREQYQYWYRVKP